MKKPKHSGLWMTALGMALAAAQLIPVTAMEESVKVSQTKVIETEDSKDKESKPKDSSIEDCPPEESEADSQADEEETDSEQTRDLTLHVKANTFALDLTFSDSTADQPVTASLAMYQEDDLEVQSALDSLSLDSEREILARFELTFNHTEDTDSKLPFSMKAAWDQDFLEHEAGKEDFELHVWHTADDEQDKGHWDLVKPDETDESEQPAWLADSGGLYVLTLSKEEDKETEAADQDKTLETGPVREEKKEETITVSYFIAQPGETEFTELEDARQILSKADTGKLSWPENAKPGDRLETDDAVYVLSDWYADKEMTKPAAEGETLSKDKTCYAQYLELRTLKISALADERCQGQCAALSLSLPGLPDTEAAAVIKSKDGKEETSALVFKDGQAKVKLNNGDTLNLETLWKTSGETDFSFILQVQKDEDSTTQTTITCGKQTIEDGELETKLTDGMEITISMQEKEAETPVKADETPEDPVEEEQPDEWTVPVPTTLDQKAFGLGASSNTLATTNVGEDEPKTAADSQLGEPVPKTNGEDADNSGSSDEDGIQPQSDEKPGPDTGLENQEQTASWILVLTLVVGLMLAWTGWKERDRKNEFK